MIDFPTHFPNTRLLLWAIFCLALVVLVLTTA